MTFVLSTDEATAVSLLTLDQGPKTYQPIPQSTGGSGNVTTQVVNSGDADPLPGDGSLVLGVLEVTHTSTTGKIQVTASWDGTQAWDGLPVAGQGNFVAELVVEAWGVAGQWDNEWQVQRGINPLLLCARKIDDTPMVFPTTGNADLLQATTALAGALVLEGSDQTLSESWTLGDGGRLNYIGEGSVFCLVTVTASLEEGGAAGDVLALAVAKNGDLVGVDWLTSPAFATNGGQSQEYEEGGDPAPVQNLTAQRYVQLNQDNYVQPVVAAHLATTDTNMRGYTMSVQVLKAEVLDGSSFAGTLTGVALVDIDTPRTIGVAMANTAPGQDGEWIPSGTLVVKDIPN